MYKQSTYVCMYLAFILFSYCHTWYQVRLLLLSLLLLLWRKRSSYLVVDDFGLDYSWHLLVYSVRYYY